jgi:predicted DNA-binding transcriptional regulator AlpA
MQRLLREQVARAKHARTARTQPRYKTPAKGPLHLINKAEVVKRVGVCYVTLWDWMQKGAFPRGRAVGGQTMWLEHEVESWIMQQPIRRIKGDPKRIAAAR